MGGGSGGVEKAISTYDSIPTVFRLSGSSYATKEEKLQRREILNKFMNEAEVGNVYQLSYSFGGDSELKIVSMNRSPNKMGLKITGSRGNTLVLNRSNVEKLIYGGAKLIRKERNTY